MVPPSSHRIPRVQRYSGSCLLNKPFGYRALTFFGAFFHTLLLDLLMHFAVLTPKTLLLLVWPVSLSLATTQEISVDFFSSPYLDVSVRAVPLPRLFDSAWDDGILRHRISPFGLLRVIVCLRLTAAFRCLPRPSSAPNAKASSLRSF